MADRSDGRFTLIGRRRTSTRISRGATPTRSITAGLLAIEGAHALDDDPANVDRLVAAGFRMMSPTPLLRQRVRRLRARRRQGRADAAGRELIARMEAGGMIVDVAHASEATIDDVLSVATRPVVASHTGVRATADITRNLADAHAPWHRRHRRAGRDRLLADRDRRRRRRRRSPARSGQPSVSSASITSVSGSDFDGGVPVPFDATGIVQITDARSWATGSTDDEIARIMGGNALRVLAAALPE